MGMTGNILSGMAYVTSGERSVFFLMYNLETKSNIGRANTQEGDKVVSDEICDELCTMMGKKVKDEKYLLDTTTEALVFISLFIPYGDCSRNYKLSIIENE